MQSFYSLHLRPPPSKQAFKEDFRSLQVTDKNHLGPTRSILAVASTTALAQLRDPKSQLSATISAGASQEAIVPWKMAPPRERLQRFVHSTAFEAFFIVVIVVNLAPIVMELDDSTSGLCDAFDCNCLFSFHFHFTRQMFFFCFHNSSTGKTIGEEKVSIFFKVDHISFVFYVVRVVSRRQFADRQLRVFVGLFGGIFVAHYRRQTRLCSGKSLGFHRHFHYVDRRRHYCHQRADG